ncbi:MAG TPA: rRNA maturation RNase YbeY [Solirubrobacteraceae bacterium]|nr:rRNA maturation RNase YbeY [Solirubrobacteraceae bacterium]
MIEVEVLGSGLLSGDPATEEVRRLCVLAAGAVGVRDGHLAVEFIEPERMARLNGEHRGKLEPTDVLSFPIDGIVEPDASLDTESEGGRAARAETVPRELGDVLICPEHATDVREAVVHGVLHLVGMDHETDDGEMLALQAELLRSDGA